MTKNSDALRLCVLRPADDSLITCNELELLINSLPISVVCHEVRPLVVKFCQSQLDHAWLDYGRDAERYWEAKDGLWHPYPPRPPRNHLEELLLKPTTLMVGMGEFETPLKFVDLICTHFGEGSGNRIEHLVLDSMVTPDKILDLTYWGSWGDRPTKMLVLTFLCNYFTIFFCTNFKTVQ